MTHFVHKNTQSEAYHYTECGLDNVWLIGGVEHEDTGYGPATAIHDMDALHRAIGADIANREKISGQEFRFLRTELELSQRALAQIIKATEQQIHRWENGKAEIPGPAHTALVGYYIEAMDPESRMKEHLDLIGQLDTELDVLKNRMFELRDDHWKMAA